MLKQEKISRPEADVVSEIRQICLEKGLQAYKIPRIYLVPEEKLGRTATGKYVRSKTMELLVNSPTAQGKEQNSIDMGELNDGGGVLSEATQGVRFLLSLVVCFNHIGDHAWPGDDASQASAWSQGNVSPKV